MLLDQTADLNILERKLGSRMDWKCNRVLAGDATTLGDTDDGIYLWTLYILKIPQKRNGFETEEAKRES